MHGLRFHDDKARNNPREEELGIIVGVSRPLHIYIYHTLYTQKWLLVQPWPRLHRAT